jgi:hypothetical protein
MSSADCLGALEGTVKDRSIKVTIADREAAAAFWRRAGCLLHGSLMYQTMRLRQLLSREREDEKLTWAFASHREAVEQRARLEGIRLGLKAAARSVKNVAHRQEPAFVYDKNVRDSAAVILALTAEEIAEMEMEADPADQGEAHVEATSTTVRYA